MYLNNGVFELNNLVKLVNGINENNKKRLTEMVEFTKKAFEMTIEEQNGHLRKPAQGDIWTVDLGENVGSEMNKIRPCVILQNNDLNLKLNTTFIIPISNRNNTSRHSVKIRSSILRPKMSEKIKGSIVAEQMRVISVSRLGKKIGELNKYGVKEVKKCVYSITD